MTETSSTLLSSNEKTKRLELHHHHTMINKAGSPVWATSQSKREKRGTPNPGSSLNIFDVCEEGGEREFMFPVSSIHI